MRVGASLNDVTTSSPVVDHDVRAEAADQIVAGHVEIQVRQDLVATEVSDQLREQRERLAAVTPGRAGLEQVVRAYLSPEHRDNPEEGCPSAALLDEITRCTDPTKQAYTDSVLAFIDEIAARLAPHDPPSARTRTLSVYALMIGTLQLSRALADRQLADDILEQGIRNALTVLDVTQQD